MKQGTTKYGKPIWTRLRPATVKKVDASARKEGRSRASMLEQLIERQLATATE